MNETTKQYERRLEGYIDGHDPIAIQSLTAKRLEHIIKDQTASTLNQRPSPDKWSITEIVAHMAEDELVSSWRYRQMIEHDGTTLEGFDQDLWAALGRYSEWTAEEALQLFRLLRETNLRMLKRLLPTQWEQSGIHAERGRITVRVLVRHMAAHDLNHLEQIEAQVRTAQQDISEVRL